MANGPDSHSSVAACAILLYASQPCATDIGCCGCCVGGCSC